LRAGEPFFMYTFTQSTYDSTRKIAKMELSNPDARIKDIEVSIKKLRENLISAIDAELKAVAYASHLEVCVKELDEQVKLLQAQKDELYEQLKKYKKYSTLLVVCPFGGIERCPACREGHHHIGEII
jgi:hypothetical protein